jgi:hypothetical protein
MRHLVLLALAVTAAPAPTAAQTLPALPAYERTMDDLGAWDAVVIGRDPQGRRTHQRGVEINTLGCGGTCVESRVEGLKDVAPPGSRRAWCPATSRRGRASSTPARTGEP